MDDDWLSVADGEKIAGQASRDVGLGVDAEHTEFGGDGQAGGKVIRPLRAGLLLRRDVPEGRSLVAVVLPFGWGLGAGLTEVRAIAAGAFAVEYTLKNSAAERLLVPVGTAGGVRLAILLWQRRWEVECLEGFSFQLLDWQIIPAS